VDRLADECRQEARTDRGTARRDAGKALPAENGGRLPAISGHETSGEQFFSYHLPSADILIE
jgi:hypothetical protein